MKTGNTKSGRQKPGTQNLRLENTGNVQNYQYCVLQSSVSVFVSFVPPIPAPIPCPWYLETAIGIDTATGIDTCDHLGCYSITHF